MSKEIKVASFGQVEDVFIAQRRQMETLQRQQAQIAADARREAENAANRRIEILREEQRVRDAQFNQQIIGLSSEMSEMNKNHQKAIQTLRKESLDLFIKQEKDFNNKLGNLQDWTQKSLNTLEREFQNSMAELAESIDKAFEEQQVQIDEVRGNVQRLYDKEADEQKRAEIMQKDLHIMIDAIDKTTLHQKYMPDRLAQLRRRLHSIADGNLPASTRIGLAHGLMNDLFDLQEDIIKKQILFEAYHNAVLNAALELLEIMRRSKNPTVKDDKGDEHEMGEIDYWTNDGYSNLQKEAESLKKELEEKKESTELNENRVKEILERITNINNEQSKLVELAIRRGLASENRVKIGEDIIIAMENQGFVLQELNDHQPAFNYLGGEGENDQREGVFAVLKNGVGTEITILIHPDETLTQNRVVFNRNDNQKLTEAEYVRQLNEIGKILKKEGYNLGDFEVPKGTGDNRQVELADPNALGSKGIRKELKKQLGLIQ